MLLVEVNEDEVVFIPQEYVSETDYEQDWGTQADLIEKSLLMVLQRCTLTEASLQCGTMSQFLVAVAQPIMVCGSRQKLCTKRFL